MKTRWFWITTLILLLALVAIYGQTWNFGFLSYDDEGYTVNCPFVKDGLSVANLVAAFRDPAWGGIWMPVTYASYMATISIFGEAPGLQHLVSLLFHCINTILFLVFLLKLAAKLHLSPSPLFIFLATALWALHPLRVESVAWVASRKDTLFTFFTLLGLLAWLKALSKSSNISPIFYFLTILCMIFGCMSKPTAMVFPALAFSLEMLVLNDFSLFHSPRRWLKYIPLLAMSIATAALAAYSQTHATGEAPHPLFYSTFSWRILNAAVSLGLYFYHTAIPEGLQFWYRPVRDGIPLCTPIALASLTTLSIATICLLIKASVRVRLIITACIIWFFAAISPTLGIAGSFGNHALADRFTYVPAMAFSIFIVLATPCRPIPKILTNILIVIPAFYAVLAARYTATYRDNMTAFANIAHHDPLHCYAWTNIGSEIILRTGDIEKGIAYFRKSIEIFPTDEAKEELAIALITRNDPKDEAEIVSICMEGLNPVANKPIPIIPYERDMKGFRSEALGVIATRHHDWGNAIICFKTAIERDPSREDCRMRLAMSLWNAKRHNEARPHLTILSQSSRPDISAKARELINTL